MKKRQEGRSKLKFHISDEEAEGSPTVSYEGAVYDIMLHSTMAKFTAWTSPASVSLAMHDWLSQLAISPAKRLALAVNAGEDLAQFALQLQSRFFNPYGTEIFYIQPRKDDNRFKDEGWKEFPFDVYEQGFLFCERWWRRATSHIRGVSRHHQDIVSFAARQLLDMFSPSNFPLTNPEILSTTLKQGGMNFLRGYSNFLEDTYRSMHKMPVVGMEKFKVGEQVAITPGKVIYRNKLIELIQYEPATTEVYAEPILIIPAWIMKYYILDLSPNNSLVKYLVEAGHTVFMISWKNPTSEDRDLGLEDYLNLGIMSSIGAINDIVPGQKIHATGYCLGGTLLMIAAAAMAALNDERLKTITLFAAQIDFRDPGELGLFIDQSQVTYLEDAMWEKGYLDGVQMADAFSMLRSNDLIWSRLIHDYLLGKRRPLNDLMAWDHDTTRLPYRMHSEYLHNLFLNNDLVRGHYIVGRRRVALRDVKEPLFCVATVKDHVSPWRSVYRVTLYTNNDVTFVLTSGGHNAGIVSEPGHKGRSYQMDIRKKGEKHMGSDSWILKAPKFHGSWWPAWNEWLISHSSGKIAHPSMGNPKKDYVVLCDAPGTYVFQH